MSFLPKSSPLQSRLAASLVVSIVISILYLAVSYTPFAYAADIDPIQGGDRGRLLDMPFMEVGFEDLELRELEYEAEFAGYDRGIIGRVPTADTPTPLINNRMVLTNVEQGQLLWYSFLNASVFGELSSITGLPSPLKIRRRNAELAGAEVAIQEELQEGGAEAIHEKYPRLQARQATTTGNGTVYITVNTCLQPQPIASNTMDPAPQLQVYISLSENNTNPGPGQDSTTQQVYPLEQGAGQITVNATGDVFIGVYGMNTTTYSNVWSAQIAASIDAPYHYYHNDAPPNIYLVDSDSSSALLITGNLTNEDAGSADFQLAIESPPPYVLFALSQNVSSIQGLENSYCAWQQLATAGPIMTASNTNNVVSGITTRGDGQPKQELYVDGLTTGSSYKVVLAMSGNSTASGSGVVGGGGQVWPVTNFTTLSGMSFPSF
jgi:calcium channel MID1